jgi:hypothetical protein
MRKMKKETWQSRAWSFNSEHESILWLAEVNFATLEELAMLKSSSKVRIDRQCAICTTFIVTIMRFQVEVPNASWGAAVRAPRIRDLMMALPDKVSDVSIYNKIYELHVNDIRSPIVGGKGESDSQ